MDNYPSHVIGHYSTLHLTRWKDLCCGKFKTVHLGYRLIELLHRGCGQWEMRFFVETDEHYEAWRGSIIKIGSNRALSAVRSLAANQCRSNRIVSTTTMEFHDAFHDSKCESCAYLSFFSIFLLFLFFCSFVLFLLLVFFSFFIHFAFRKTWVGSFLMLVVLYITIENKRKLGYICRTFRFCEIKK